MKLWCNHKWREVNSKGYQYCIKCNKAKFIGIPPCKHKWSCVKNFQRQDNLTKEMIASISVLECEFCGERKKFIEASIMDV